jgi:urea-proton symporter
MYGTSYIFSKPFFRFWVALTFIWAFGATLVITIMPLWEGRNSIRNFVKFARGRRGKQLVEGLTPEAGSEREQGILVEAGEKA